MLHCVRTKWTPPRSLSSGSSCSRVTLVSEKRIRVSSIQHAVAHVFNGCSLNGDTSVVDVLL